MQATVVGTFVSRNVGATGAGAKCLDTLGGDHWCVSMMHGQIDIGSALSVQDAGSGLLGTIEDFMWYKLALVRPAPQDGPSTSSGYFSGVPQ